ncbi:beta-ketoacyl-ACP synthase [Mesorhizobium sp. M4B.F.Ca.ET.215.01.1.1]|uniref:beta-ketoacyl-ACP synthase n=4 Tax=Mesorhizobium TaxID=68287 RepID=UPI000FE8D10F|nr:MULTISPECIES: beta-ketoacyl-ACP synthase [unclassified Mesorhizobium]RWF62157.1 MAG: beta-ketoacyl-ACP synthase [Mesorhizobium sp.]TGQ05117.1 beta-ketoacyl-ACP synthase [Mesorhizobium sp. M4B.F.Ca.ET.215.01.1.1]TGQ33648.1 beta-ketoacyl-ACP synthase [Mesorhizobium sp. M4B.F.Ca.ET.214.01.1.1]TGQ40836.1 beta-ketoacyl-ACP synthase [Mesorhizobium sp. M00.F.Ca.ET.220.01.1.1]TGQ60752.1 beta-ketoacyl-ACP synthase [Mesorhizobium sp. M4B.F.Ca.ET.211.01.1.1]
MSSPHDVVITGIGLVSSLGEGPDAHWQKLAQPGLEPVLDAGRFAPYTIHPLPEIDWNLQIAKRGDQRQMETWQRLGTYAAGLALDDAGIKGNDELCATMDMVVAAGGGERDEAVDAAILAASESRNDRDVLLNEKLTTELRPTLFLAQLSNLLAGNISIVHKVTGSSRTFMGEEGAGVAAVETAAARIRSGQSTHVLVGGAFQTEHSDMLLGYELAGYLHRGAWKPVWQRQGGEGGGVVTGSGGAFLVLEQREHATSRGRKIYAELGPIVSGRAKRRNGGLDAEIATLLDQTALPNGELLAISGASGAHTATAAERAAFAAHPAIAARAFSTLTGHMKEAQFPFAVALAALTVERKAAYPAFDAATEKPFAGIPTTVLATAIGYHQFEGMGLIKAA